MPAATLLARGHSSWSGSHTAGLLSGENMAMGVVMGTGETLDVPCASHSASELHVLACSPVTRLRWTCRTILTWACTFQTSFRCLLAAKR